MTDTQTTPASRLWIGTYPGDVPGAEGIWDVSIDPVTGELGAPVRLAEAQSPSYLAKHPHAPVLYAVDESETGEVSAFTIAPDGGLTHAWTGSSGGTHPCHVTADDGVVCVSNYGSGALGAITLGTDGLPIGASRSYPHSGTGGNPDRQSGPHVHSSGRTVDGRFVWVADLGTDEVWRYRLDERPSEFDSTPPLEPDGIAVAMPAGSGPRHMAFHRSGLVFVVGELDNAVHVVRFNPADGSGTLLGTVPACVTPTPQGAPGAFPSHVTLNDSGTRLYIGIRGTDVVSAFAVFPDGAGPGGTGLDGEGPDGGGAVGTGPVAAWIEHLGDTPVGGAWPRHIAVISAPDDADGGPVDRVIVANQNSADLVVLDIDAAGRGTQRSTIEFPVPPACVLPR